MQDFVRQAKSILSVYAQRGLAALDAFDRGQVDEATELLKKRSAAFHNFRAVDAHIVNHDTDLLAEDPEVQQLLSSIQHTDKLLVPRLAEAHAATKQLVHKLKNAQQKIARYRSGPLATTHFEKSA